MSARAATSIYGTEQSLHDGAGDVNRHHDLHAADITDAAAGGYNDIHGDKAKYFREEIHKSATGGQSAAEMEYDVVGGMMYHTLKHGSHIMSTIGAEGKAFLTAVEHARDTGKGWIDSVRAGMEAAPEGGATAIEHWVKNETQNKLNGLTPEQQEVYKSGLIWGIGGHDGGPLSQYLAAPLSDAKENLIKSDPGMGADIGELLQRAAGQNRPDLIGLVESYNGSVKKKHNDSTHSDSIVGGHSHSHALPATPESLAPIFSSVEKKYDLPEGLLERMAMVESSFSNEAVSRKGAEGLMQLMPATAERFGVKDPTDPNQAIEGAGKYMRWLLDRYHGNLVKAVAGYNAGEGSVDQYNGIPPFNETIEYVDKVMRRGG